jgi:hypothetical protein
VTFLRVLALIGAEVNRLGILLLLLRCEIRGPEKSHETGILVIVSSVLISCLRLHSGSGKEQDSSAWNLVVFGSG